jgi:serine-type D-Ala-D-Ala carboxypeptidase/endopeptidase
LTRAGTIYEQLLRTRICEPLGLVDTWLDTPESGRRRVASGHTWRVRKAPPWHLAALAGAGGLRSTAADLLAFLRLHAATWGSPLAAAAAETARPRAAWRRVQIGLGWLIVPSGRRLLWRRTPDKLLLHEGGTGGFRILAGVVPEIEAGTVVLTNQARPPRWAGLGLRVLDALIHEPSRD